MSAWTVAAVGALIHEHPALIPVLEEHLDDFEGEVLAHLLLSDIVRWMAKNQHSEPKVVRSIIRWWAKEYEDGHEDVSEMIVVSGLEMIPNPGDAGSELRDLLPRTLRRADPWGYQE